MIALFDEFLEKHQVLTATSDLLHYGKDHAEYFSPTPAFILLPENIQQVQQIVALCNANQLTLVPSGGRTGLSGGAVATNGEIVLSLERMRTILNVKALDRTLTCQAGVITENIHEEAAKHDLYFPIKLASQGSSQIGGNIATNAGGVNVIKYGCVRDWVLGLKIVTGKGTLLDLNGSLYKNQTGYDLKSLIIGSEGTLGIIVEATLKLTQLPTDITRVLCAVESIDSVHPLLAVIREKFEQLSAFEYFADQALQFVLKHNELRAPFQQQHPYFVLIEIENTSRNKIENAFVEVFSAGLVSDVIISASAKQAREIMGLRELISETLSSHHTVHRNDLSVSVGDAIAFIKDFSDLTQKEYPQFPVIVYGHLGDGNLHVEIIKPEELSVDDFHKHCQAKDCKIFELVQKYEGSISAEHGVGLLKKPYLSFSRSKPEIQLMRDIKKIFDPNGILNPGKIFDP
ncbi:FAD-binding oxidoreductase [Oligoflexia bacterium]|nr:FAD-binding oxidoreductase [Oligoflexia bacterium]